MKIVSMIRWEPHLIYFANRIHQSFPLALAIVEKPSRDLSWFRSFIGKHGACWAFLLMLDALINKKVSDRNHSRFFQESWRTLDPQIPVMFTEDINAAPVNERLQRLKPDLILDHGTSIVKNDILRTSSLALNLHWGLSPYYRGTHCTEWALLNWDPANIGVTIHRLSRKIDGGSIVVQARATLSPDDTVHTINMQLTQKGTDLCLAVLEKILSGDELTFHRQELAQGFLKTQRQWTFPVYRNLRGLERSGALALMLDKPSRPGLPIVTLE